MQRHAQLEKMATTAISFKNTHPQHQKRNMLTSQVLKMVWHLLTGGTSFKRHE